MTVTVEEIPLAPAPQDIKPGRRVRIFNISPACLNGLTGITQANPTSRATTRLDVLLDESSTELLRRDTRVGKTRKTKVPGPDVTRQLLNGIPTACMFYAENDS
ncbi:hypothetical protein [Streptomyces noursei]|uniref:hypothetical protein n=1 Tax=Streptomyces noursei TaxID=1971 RepID=UPI0037F63854